MALHTPVFTSWFQAWAQALCQPMIVLILTCCVAEFHSVVGGVLHHSSQDPTILAAQSAWRVR